MVELPFEQLEGRNKKERKEGKKRHTFQHKQLILTMIKQLIEPTLMKNTRLANNHIV